MIADKKRVLKQFQWFQVQTKVRQLIAEILQPFQKKINNSNQSLSKLLQNSKVQHQKVQQITLMINNDQNIFKKGIFTNIQTKFDNQTMHIKQLQNKIQHLESYITQKSTILDKRLQQSNQVLTNMNIFKEDIKNQVQSQGKIIIQSQSNIFKNLQDINRQITQSKIKLNGFQGNLSVNNFKIHTIQQQFKQLDLKISKNLQDLNQNLKQTRELANLNDNSISKLQKQIKRIDKFQQINKRQKLSINQCFKKIDQFQYKVQVLQPLISFTQINEYAHKILPQKYHKNIQIYYYNKYNILIQQIINNDYQKCRIKQSVKSNLQNIKQCHKKAIKKIFNIKKEILLDRGIDINQCTHQKKEQYLQSIKLQEDLDIFDDQQVTKKKAANDQQQINRIKNEFLEMINNFKQKLYIQLKDSKIHIQSIEELITRNNIQIQNKANSIQKNNQKNQVEVSLYLKNFQGQLKSINKKLLVQKQNNKQNKKSIKQIQDILININPMQIQQQLDRFPSSIIGLEQNNNNLKFQNGTDKEQNQMKSQELILSSRYQSSNNQSKEFLIRNSLVQQTKLKNQQLGIRNIASSQQIRTNNTSEQRKVIYPSQFSSEILNRTKNHFYSRKLQRSYNKNGLQKLQLQRKKSKQKNSYMLHVSHFFRQLKKHNEQAIKLK